MDHNPPNSRAGSRESSPEPDRIRDNIRRVVFQVVAREMEEAMQRAAGRTSRFEGRTSAYARGAHFRRSLSPPTARSVPTATLCPPTDPTVPLLMPGTILPRQHITIPTPNMWAPAHTTETAVAENYWPNIAHFLSSGQGPKPLVECIICSVKKLTIPGLQEPEPEKEKEEADDFEPHHILRCGHVLGRPCLDRWVRESLADEDLETALNGAGPRCPVCRQPVYATRAELAEAREQNQRWALRRNLRATLRELRQVEGNQEEDEEMVDVDEEEYPMV
ncbi:hypothetical protein VTK26DRAFT_478 [Humicola hyalothermophila]